MTADLSPCAAVAHAAATTREQAARWAANAAKADAEGAAIERFARESRAARARFSASLGQPRAERRAQYVAEVTAAWKQMHAVVGGEA